MLSFERIALVVVSFHSNRIVTKTSCLTTRALTHWDGFTQLACPLLLLNSPDTDITSFALREVGGPALPVL